jgi:hypothetical protein
MGAPAEAKTPIRFSCTGAVEEHRVLPDAVKRRSGLRPGPAQTELSTEAAQPPGLSALPPLCPVMPPLPLLPPVVPTGCRARSHIE